MSNKLGLGTIEFAHQSGKHALSVSLEEARRILEIAQDAHVELLDTAAQYGNSEEVLGRCLTSEHRFKILAKTPMFNPEMMSAHYCEQLEAGLQESLNRLETDRIYGLMMRYEESWWNLQGEKCYKRLEQLKEQGLIEKIGISIQSGLEIDQVLKFCTPDIFQLPINVLDQRLLRSGHLNLLNKKQVEIHARDVFLQGVLLDPTHLHPWFWELRQQFERYHRCLIEEGLTPMEGALNFVTSLPEVNYALVGVQSLQQLTEIIAASGIKLDPSRFYEFASASEKYVNPLQWNLYA